MKRGAGAACLAGALGLLALSGIAVAMPPASRSVAHSRLAFQAGVADRALMARVLAASRTERRPAPPDASYLHDLWSGIGASLGELISQATRGLSFPAWLLWSVASLLAVAVASLLVRGWLLGSRRAKLGGAGRLDVLTAPPEDAGGNGRRGGDLPSWDAASWRLELERRLAREQVAEALRATWWWLARSLAGARVEATWTGRELLRRSRRDDLRDLMLQLDVLTYGPRPPGTEEVRRLAGRLEAALE